MIDNNLKKIFTLTILGDRNSSFWAVNENPRASKAFFSANFNVSGSKSMAQLLSKKKYFVCVQHCRPIWKRQMNWRQICACVCESAYLSLQLREHSTFDSSLILHFIALKIMHLKCDSTQNKLLYSLISTSVQNFLDFNQFVSGKMFAQTFFNITKCCHFEK